MSEADFKRVLKLFPRSPIWDKQTQRIVDMIRAFVHRNPPPTISFIQQSSLKAGTFRGDFHIVQEEIEAPSEDDARRAFFQAIQDMGRIDHEHPATVPITLEWVGKRKSKSHKEKEEVRESLMRLYEDAETDLTILHVHGGGFFQGSPASYRATTTRLAELSKGRVVSVEYRLAPQNPLPAAMLDVYIAYLALLYPNPGSGREPIPPSKIVFAGDSGGATMLFILLLVIQHSQHYEPIRFHSQQVLFPLPYPTGIAAASLAGDFIQSVPSYSKNRVHDIMLGLPPWGYPDYPQCNLWPVTPMRPMMHLTDLHNFTHPIASLCLAKNWTGSPAMWFGSGDEQFVDGARAVARRAAAQHVDVTWVTFEAMPHDWSTLPGLSRSRQSDELFKRMAAFCQECIRTSSQDAPRKSRVSATKLSFKDLQEHRITLESAEDPSVEELERLIRAQIARIWRDYESNWKGRINARL